MRPNDTQHGASVYECFTCGDRVQSPSTSSCPSCGGALRNVGVPRDL